MQYLAEGESQLKAKDYAGARKSLTNCIQDFNAGDGYNRKLLARAYNSRGQVEYLCVNFFEAIYDYSQALKLDPDFSVALYNRGLIHYRLGQYSLALEDFERARRLDPGFRDVVQAIEAAKLEQTKTGDKFWPDYKQKVGLEVS